MATIGVNYPTLADLTKQLGPDHKLTRAINLMTQRNEIIKRFPMIQANGKTGHLASVLVGLPTPAWRKLNGGTVPSTDSHAQILETCSMLESVQQTDKRLAKLSGNEAEYRMGKARSHLEALAQEAATVTFYGDKSTPEKPLGLAPRFNALSGAENSQNVINGGGSGSDNASIWLLGLSDQTLTGIYPEGSTGGISHTPKDDHIVQNAGGVTGAVMEAFLDIWKWDFGIAVLDWRWIVRICNIDISNLVSKSSAADLIELMINALYRLPEGEGAVNPVFCMNRTVLRMLDVQRRDDVITGGGLTFDNVDGKRQPSFRGVPILVTDALTNAEATVS